MMGAPVLIAIAGPPGGGKTTLLRNIARRLADCAWLSMDSFPAPFAMPADALARWLSKGADFGGLQVPGFAGALGALKAGRPVIEPHSGRRVEPASLILAEAPLGRAHEPSAALIDTLIWIDIPLDVALARNILAWEDEHETKPPGWLGGYMRNYLAITRDVLTAQKTQVAPGADLVVDGLLSPSEQAEAVIQAMGLGG